MKKIILFLCLQAILVSVEAQNKTIEGHVFAKEDNEVLIGANISTYDGLYGTVTDIDGYFKLSIPNTYKVVKASYIGFNEQEIAIQNGKISIALSANVLNEVEVSYKKLDRSTIDPYNTQTLNEADLTKAACCNLSESFETTAAIDVSFSDAVTGAKRIRMLGLDSYYTQIMHENQPSIRGLGNTFGFLFVPGPFMRSIAINKGSGSVSDGFEAITGQINYDYKEPNDSERFFLNLFGSRHGQFELNTNVSHRFSDKLSTILMVHGMIHESKHDDNHDSFQDVPLNERIVLSNKWFYNSQKVFRSRFGFSYTFDERSAGQLAQLDLNEGQSNLFQTMNINRRYDAFAKTGFLFKSGLNTLGVQYRYYNHQHHAWYGNRFYNGLENFAKLNVIYQTQMHHPYHKMKIGFSYQLDFFKESLNDLVLNRQERIPGIFAEYTYQDCGKMSLIVGLRADVHNIYGFWLSPKANFRYTFPKRLTIKLSGGKGYRTANLIAENIAGLASSRTINVADNIGYESAWNFGGNVMKEFYLGFQQASIVVDYYRTDFTNRIVSDYEQVGQLNFYNLDGKSYANSFQVETKVEAAEGLDLQLAYKFDDVVINYESGLKLAPYIPRHKLLLTLDYESKNEMWRFNVTGQMNGKSRLPSTAENPIAYQRPDESPIFFTLNSQITAKVKKWEFYVGGENLTNYWQKNPIIGADDAFGKYFDASMVWGPLGGARIYGGLRYNLPYNNEKKNK